MQFNNINSTRQGLVEDVLYNCGLPTVSASYSSYALADITRNINNAYLEVVPLIWKSAYKWRYDDSNATDLPIGYANIYSSQQDYEIPPTSQRIYSVSRKNGDNYVTLSQINEDDFVGGTGNPTGYCLVGRSVLLDPSPSSDVSAGLKVVFDRTPDLFTTASTTASPGFAESFHKILSYAAAIDFVQDKGAQDRLVAMKARLENQLVAFYSKRNVGRKANLKIKKYRNTYK